MLELISKPGLSANHFREIAYAVASVAVTTVISLVIVSVTGYVTVALLYLLLVVFAGLNFTRWTVLLMAATCNEVKLTATEYALLKVLAQHAGKVVTHKQLLREVWGPKGEEQSQYLRVYVTHLRKKMEISRAPAKLITTESGIGYRLVIPTSTR